MVDASAVSIPVKDSDATRQPTLSMVDITKRFEGVAALTDVSLDVLGGEVHALLGENGAGKSTLMNIASGTLAPDVGTIVFDGEEIGELTPAVAREIGIAMVHQHPAILPDMTVAENIRAPSDASISSGEMRTSPRRCVRSSTTCISSGISRTVSRR